MRILYRPGVNTALRTLLRPLASSIPAKYRFGITEPFTLVLPNGRTLRISSNQTSYVSKMLFWEGMRGYEPHLFDVFTRIAAHAKGFVDVGANIGYYTLLARAYNHSLAVLSIEPMPAALHFLNLNLALNAIEGVEVVDAALSDISGQVEFYEARNRKYPYLEHHLTGASGLSVPGDGYVHDAPILVPVTTLDALGEQYNLESIDLVKIDAEGAEAGVLRGGKAMLEKHQPVVLFECDPGHQEAEIESFFNHHGYALYNAQPEGLVRTDTISPANLRFHDFVAIPQKWRDFIFSGTRIV